MFLEEAARERKRERREEKGLVLESDWKIGARTGKQEHIMPILSSAML